MEELEGDLFREPLQDEHDVYSRAAFLFSEIEDWHKKNPEFREGKDGEVSFMEEMDELDAMSNIPQDLVLLHHQRQSFYEIVAAHPKFRKFLVSWRVEVTGYTGIDPEKIKKDENDSEDGFKELSEEESEKIWNGIGGIFSAVQSYLDKNDFLASECEATESYWRIGLQCNDFAADELCDKIHKKFKKAIATGMITVRKSFFGMQLVGLTLNNYESFLNGEKTIEILDVDSDDYDNFDDYDDYHFDGYSSDYSVEEEFDDESLFDEDSLFDDEDF